MIRDPFFFQSSRRFVTYSYDAGHGLLLFRSGKSNQNRTRFDVLFQDVRALELRLWTDGLRIEEAGPGFGEEKSSNPLKMMEVGNKLYCISGNDWSGYIVAGVVLLHEDEKEFCELSTLLSVAHN